MSRFRLSGVIFLDGPAAGAELHLKSAPVLLRVVIGPRGAIDALNLAKDVARPTEKIVVYRLATLPTYLHMKARAPLGGSWAKCDYAVLPEQPGDEHVRDNAAWSAWIHENRERLTPDCMKGEQPA